MSSNKFTEAPPECQLHHVCKSYCETAREVKESLCTECLEVRDSHFAGAKGEPWNFGYTNYRGEFSQRRATPIRFEFESTEFHPEKQWIMHAIDHEKGFRAFALADMVLGYDKTDSDRLLKYALFACIADGGMPRKYGGVLVKDSNYAWIEFNVKPEELPKPTSYVDISDVKQRFPDAPASAVQRIAELEQLVAAMVVIGAQVRPDVEQSLAFFSEWDENVRVNKPFGSTMNMKTERKNAYIAGLNKGLDIAAG